MKIRLSAQPGSQALSQKLTETSRFEPRNRRVLATYRRNSACGRTVAKAKAAKHLWRFDRRKGNGRAKSPPLRFLVPVLALSRLGSGLACFRCLRGERDHAAVVDACGEPVESEVGKIGRRVDDPVDPVGSMSRYGSLCLAFRTGLGKRRGMSRFPFSRSATSMRRAIHHPFPKTVAPSRAI